MRDKNALAKRLRKLAEKLDGEAAITLAEHADILEAAEILLSETK